MPNTSDSVELAVLEHLQKGQLLLQKSQREAGIQAEVNKFKGAGTKRAVKFTKELLFQCEDLADIFKVEEGEEFATKDNLDDVNKAVLKFNTLLEEHKNSIQHELNMQIVAASSPLKWKTVKQLEGSLELPACVTIDSTEVRKAEKDSMAFARDLSVAKKRSLESASSGYFSKRGRGRGRGGSLYNGRGGSGDSTGNSTRSCFKCGDMGHLIAKCPK